MKGLSYKILCIGLIVKRQLLLMGNLFLTSGLVQGNIKASSVYIFLLHKLTCSTSKIWDKLRGNLSCKLTSPYSQWFLYSCIIIVTLLHPYSTKAVDKDKMEWMQNDINELNERYKNALPVPDTLDSGMKEGNALLDLTQSNWIATNQQVEANKAIKFDWDTSGATTVNSNKYKVLYRIDPRFKEPQIFIKRFNPQTNKYEATDYPALTTTGPDKDYPYLALALMPQYVEYFTSKSPKILIKPGDVINITLTDADDFFVVDADPNILASELDSSPIALSMLYTNSNLINKIIYSSAKEVCDFLDPRRTSLCQTTTDGKALIKDNDRMGLVGKPLGDTLTNSLLSLISSCPEGRNDKDNSPACYYDQGRGMNIRVNDTIIKSQAESFAYSTKLNKYFLYYKSNTTGNLNFTTDWHIAQGMFDTTTSTFMQDWGAPASIAKLHGRFKSKDLGAHYLHFGRYIMKVEVGNGEKGELTAKQQQNIHVKYVIVGAGEATPTASTPGITIDQNASIDAQNSGYLWLKVENPNPEVSGVVNVKYAAYTGSTWFSDIVFTKIVSPIITKFHQITKDFYTKLARNPSLVRISKLALILYVSIYALSFLAGVVKITAKDLLIRLFKITLIVTLVQENSWEFFNTYLFSIFTDGTYYIAKNVVGITSNNANIFGFIDPIFARYTNGQFWLLLFIELLQINNGFTIIALMVIYSLTLYFRAILEVIVSYVVAYVGISVMISLAPFFFILLLFEKTKTIFDNWISTLFSYVVQPSILLIFFLLIDQIISEQLLKTVVSADWGILIPIRIGLDLHYLGIPFETPSFEIPFFPGIPFFIPNPIPLTTLENFRSNTGTFLVIFSSALLFYSFCLMSKGLVHYITIVAAQLTNVIPAKREGKRQEPDTPASSIVDDITGGVTKVKNVALAPARILKEKFIDQNYTAKRPQGSTKKNYLDKIFASRNDRDT
ncbi:type IV secretion system protein [Candidatus Tisiphia endosymbiont of Nemotelus uliginosus]|uniref:type IV secretion system protein n=1 Tax=Candidatus Tisiphia endosymbiont of Nemotelus uliginosus TaxID=3077926 RepID=UPI0035C89523